MDTALRQQLLAATEQALAADDWPAVERIWQPYIDQGDLEAHYQLAYHYLWCSGVDDDATRDRMYDLLRHAASKDHPDAVWFLASRQDDLDREQSPVYERELLRAGRLGSMHAQRALGVAYATGDWTGPKDLTEAVRWYRRAADQGELTSQYDLGLMLLLGEGEPRNVPEGLEWLERAAEAGQTDAIQVLADCYENGYCEVPIDPEKAAYWRAKWEQYERDNPPPPIRSYALPRPIVNSSLPALSEFLWEIYGVVNVSFWDATLAVSYDPTKITPEQLDEKVQASGRAIPQEQP